jgi:Multiubiquitin
MNTLESESKKHETAIIINGRPVQTRLRELTFDQVVELSGLPTGPNIVFTITYRRGHGHKPEGSMVEGGERVKVKEGMIFNVDSTDRS